MSGAGWPAKGYLFCRKGEVREIMRPIPVPGDDGTPRWGLCDGLHRDDHELVPPEPSGSTGPP